MSKKSKQNKNIMIKRQELATNLLPKLKEHYQENPYIEFFNGLQLNSSYSKSIIIHYEDKSSKTLTLTVSSENLEELYDLFVTAIDKDIKQYQKNSDYNARLEAQERARMVPREMYDRTNTMLPIGGYLNNFARFQPNELR